LNRPPPPQKSARRSHVEIMSSTTIICPNSCPRWGSAQACLCNLSLCCQRLLGMMASLAIALPVGILGMRPFQIWYLSMRLNAVTDRHLRVVVSSRCRKALVIWRTPWFLAASGTMGIVSRRGDHRRFHQRLGSCLRRERCERSLVGDRGRVSHKCVRTVVLALRHFLPRLSGQHVLV